jgi:uncharacterized integral membrane protein (TIGR00697 family)
MPVQAHDVARPLEALRAQAGAQKPERHLALRLGHLAKARLFFPISYVFGDILTEVYGYARARRVIWAGFGGLAFASFMAYVVVALPPAPFWKNQEAYEIAFGQAWRIAGASMIGRNKRNNN